MAERNDVMVIIPKHSNAITYVRNPPMTIQVRDTKWNENPLENILLLCEGYNSLRLKFKDILVYLV